MFPMIRSAPWSLTRIAGTEDVLFVRADAKLTAFVELEAASRVSGRALHRNQALPDLTDFRAFP
jgi:hypothetical protein